MHSIDPIDDNSKKSEAFWGQIASTYNATTPPERQRTAKHLKDHWVACNKKVTTFNDIYIRLEDACQSGIDDHMI